MALFKGHLIKKNINGIITETYNTIIVTNDFYETNGEEVVVIKEVENCNLILNSKTTEHVVVKALTNVLVTTNELIDEEFNEVELTKGSCVEFRKIGDFWYILSSDGLKNS